MVARSAVKNNNLRKRVRAAQRVNYDVNDSETGRKYACTSGDVKSTCPGKVSNNLTHNTQFCLFTFDTEVLQFFVNASRGLIGYLFTRDLLLDTALRKSSISERNSSLRT